MVTPHPKPSSPWSQHLGHQLFWSVPQLPTGHHGQIPGDQARPGFRRHYRSSLTNKRRPRLTLRIRRDWSLVPSGAHIACSRCKTPGEAGVTGQPPVHTGTQTDAGGFRTGLAGVTAHHFSVMRGHKSPLPAILRHNQHLCRLLTATHLGGFKPSWLLISQGQPPEGPSPHRAGCPCRG